MKTTERFDNAVTKLYNAFHNGELEMEDCKKCAVGNIVGHGNWTCGSPSAYILDKKPIRDMFIRQNESGYSKENLAKVEWLFIMAHNDWNDTDKKAQFKGLCAVVEYLCELDGIPNVMDYKSLFEYDDLGIVNPIEHLVGATQ